MKMTQTRQKELKFVLLAVTAFSCFSLFKNSMIIGFIGIGFIIFAYLALRSLQKTEKQTSLTSSVSYVGFWVRLGSLIIDAGIYGFFSILMHFFLQEKASLPLVYGGFYLCWLAVVLYMVKTWGQSPGKIVMGIKIVKTDLSPLGWKEVFLRDWNGIFSSIRYFTEYLLIFLGVLSASLVFTGTADPSAFSSQYVKIIHDKFLIFDMFWLCSEPIVLLTNRRNRALHDYLAGTVVVLAKKKNKIKKYSGAIVLISIFIFCVSIYFYHKDQFKNRLIAAQNGTPLSQRVLAGEYYYGIGVKKSYTDAFIWYQKAAEGGDAKAQEYLGIMYEKGYSVKADRNEAIKWYNLSWKNGDYEARDALFRLGVKVDPYPR